MYLTFYNMLKIIGNILLTLNLCPFLSKVNGIHGDFDSGGYYGDWSFNTDETATRRVSQLWQSLVTRGPRSLLY